MSKLFAEKIGEYYAFHTSMNVVSLRLARLFGYGERDSVVFTKYIKQSLLKNTLEVWGEGETSIEYLYVKDATKAIEQAIIKDIKSGVYNVGVNQTYSVKEIANLIATVFDNKENIVFARKNRRELLYFNGFKCIFSSYKLESSMVAGRSCEGHKKNL